MEDLKETSTNRLYKARKFKEEGKQFINAGKYFSKFREHSNQHADDLITKKQQFDTLPCPWLGSISQ